MNEFTVVLVGDDFQNLTYHAHGLHVDGAVVDALKIYKSEFEIDENEDCDVEVYAVFNGHLENLYVQKNY